MKPKIDGSVGLSTHRDNQMERMPKNRYCSTQPTFFPSESSRKLQFNPNPYQTNYMQYFTEKNDPLKKQLHLSKKVFPVLKNDFETVLFSLVRR